MEISGTKGQVSRVVGDRPGNVKKAVEVLKQMGWDVSVANGGKTSNDHDTGKIRGLLCKRCNSSIGLLDDSICL